MTEKPTIHFDQQNEYFEETFKALDLSEACLVGKVFEQCQFIQCNFTQADLKKCRFCDCEFKSCNLSVMKIKGCSFSGVVFEESKMIGINWTEAAWPTIKLACPISFFKCDVSHSNFLGVNLREIKLVECRAYDVDFREADLTQANLSYSDFKNSLFINTHLTEADLTYADNYRIDVSLNTIKRAKFTLPEAVGLLYGLDIELME